MHKMGIVIVAAAWLGSAAVVVAADSAKPTVAAKKKSRSHSEYVRDCLDGDKDIVRLTRAADRECANTCRSAHQELVEQSLMTDETCIEVCGKALRQAASETCPADEADPARAGCIQGTEDAVKACPDSCGQGQQEVGRTVASDCKRSLRDCLERCPTPVAK